MKNIGEAFSFYLKYYPEMEALYAEEEYDLLPDNEKLRLEEIDAKVNKIGDLACEEVADFLIKASDLIVQTLESKAGAAKLTRRSTMVSEWYVDVQVWKKEIKTKPKDWNYSFGVGFKELEGDLKLIIWSWCHSNITPPDKTAQNYRNIFPKAINPFPGINKKSIVWDIADINLSPDQGELFVDEDKLMESVKKTTDLFVEYILPNYLLGYPNI